MPYKTMCKIYCARNNNSLWTYLNDQVLNRLLILWRILVKLVLQAVDREDLEVFHTLVALLHLFKACLVVAARHHLAMLDLLISHSLFMSLRELDQLFLVDPFRFMLTVTLALNLNLKGFLVSVLSHHTLQLEGVSIQLHVQLYNFNKYFNLN